MQMTKNVNNEFAEAPDPSKASCLSKDSVLAQMFLKDEREVVRGTGEREKLCSGKVWT